MTALKKKMSKSLLTIFTWTFCIFFFAYSMDLNAHSTDLNAYFQFSREYFSNFTSYTISALIVRYVNVPPSWNISYINFQLSNISFQKLRQNTYNGLTKIFVSFFSFFLKIILNSFLSVNWFFFQVLNA